MSFLGAVREMADATPADRNRAVDALRAASILVVVLGHWLMAAVTVEGGELTPTMKLKRRVIDEKYSSIINALYADAENTTPAG